MASRYAGTVTVEAEVEIADVLREIDTKDLREELERRDARRGLGQPDCGTEIRLSSWDASELKTALHQDDGRRVIDVLKGALS